MSRKLGDTESFDNNWKNRAETNYLHWTRGKPSNQIQLAFQQHWSLFQQIMGPDFQGKRVLEVGCGRGSMSAFFADNGFQCTLLDISESVVDTARRIFSHHGLDARFDVGDALNLPYEDGSFDVVVSIGLLEHFEDFGRVISEQVRILDRGGLFLGYVVPENRNNVQKDYAWINNLLKAIVPRKQMESVAQKADIYRSDILSEPYLDSMRLLRLHNIGSSGVYPLPMISHSVEFPFTLLNDECEAILVEHFTEMLESRARETGKHPWLCDESFGQAFLLWAYKD